MAENITLQFNVQGKKGMQDALAEVQGALAGVEGTTTTTNQAMQKQGSTAGRVAKKTAEVAAAHAAFELAMKGATKATNSGIGAVSTFGQAATAARGSVSGMKVALGNAAKSAGRFVVRLAALAAPLAPFAIGGGVVLGLTAINKALIAIASSAANIAPVADAFDRLSRRIGATGEALRDDLRRAVSGTVPELELMQSSVIALNSGAIESRETLIEFAEGARILARTVGMDTAKAFDNLIRGTGLMNPQLLKSLGILVSVDEATRSYARANGLVVSELTDAQKHEAFRIEVLNELRGATRRVGDSTDDLQTSLQRSAAAGEMFERGIRSAIAEAEGLKEVAEDMSRTKQAVTELALEIAEPLVTAVTNASAEMLSWVTGPLDAVVRKIRGTKDEAETLNTSLEDSVLPGITVLGNIPTPALPTKAFADLGEEMTRINRLQTAMGGLFDSTAARMNALRQAIKDALMDSWDPLSERVQELRRALQALQVEAQGAVGGQTFAAPGIPAVELPDVSGIVERSNEVFQNAEKGVEETFAPAMDVAITSLGSMAQAAVRGTQQMEVSVINTFSSILQSLTRQGGPLSGVLGGFGGAIFGAVGGILSAVVGGGGREPQPVKVDSYGDEARRQQREDRGPEVVNVNLLDAEGNVIRTVQQIRRRSALDGVDRLPRGA